MIFNMARTSLLAHIAMIVIAGTIAFMYIYPTIQQIRQNQDTAVLFSGEVAKVSEVNAKLQQKVSAINSIPLQDKQKLVTYMPDSLDDVSILRIMEAILITVGIEASTLQFGSGGSEDNGQDVSFDSTLENNVVNDSKTVQSTVAVAFEADEASLFTFFEAVERSSVPFVVKEVELAPSESGLVSAELVYSVYALASETSSASVFADEVMNDTDFDF